MLIYTEDARAAKKAEKNEKLAKNQQLKTQIHLNNEVERLTNKIRKKMKQKKPIENILPKIYVKDHEALAKAITNFDSLSDSEKGRLFLRMDTDFISKVLTHFSIPEKVLILKQLDSKKREDVLFRFSLSHRKELKRLLK